MAYEDIIGRLTLEEKCALLQGASAFGTRAIVRLDIPELQFSDGPHGLRHQDPTAANHLGMGESLPATCFPTAATVAQSWDPLLGERLGAALGEEAACQGVGCVLGPGLNIKRSPLGGRNFEYFSEDPCLAGTMAAAYVRGIQSQGVAACPKHFAANSQETRRMTSDSVLDERTLREIYLTAFETVVREGRPMAIMSSYNRVNGIYANESSHLLQDILRDEWGFDGAVVSDWGGSNDHVAGVAAGSTFEMPGPVPAEARGLAAAVRAGSLTEAQLNTAVADALALVLTTRPAVEAAAGTAFDVEAHHQLAHEVAAQSIVLLKNDADAAGKTLLPLAPCTRVALVGSFAEQPHYQGDGSSLVNSTRVDTLLDVMRQGALDLVGYECGFDRSGTGSPTHAQAAARLAAHADVAVVCLGLNESMESEGADRPHMRLARNQLDVLAHVAQSNPNVVVLLSCGSPVETDWVRDARAVLHLSLGGQAGARAVFDVLTGLVNPSGKLAETWPRRIEETPAYGSFPSGEPVAAYREGLYVGYRYYQSAQVPAAFPFGYGLSYTSFAYSDLRATPDAVSFTLANVGTVAGAEVCQLYVAKPERTVFAPIHELRGFVKVRLEPGERRRVRMALDRRAYSYWNVGTHAWEVEGGTYLLEVGASSADIRLTAAVQVAGTGAPNPYEGKRLPAYESGEVQGVDPAQFANLLGRAVPRGKVALDRNLCIRDLNHGRSLFFWIVWLVVGRLVRLSATRGRPNPSLHFVWNMPLRALATNVGAFFSMGMVDALVLLVRGWGWLGLAVGIVLKTALGMGVGALLLTWALVAWAPFVAQLVGSLAGNALFATRLARRAEPAAPAVSKPSR